MNFLRQGFQKLSFDRQTDRRHFAGVQVTTRSGVHLQLKMLQQRRK